MSVLSSFCNTQLLNFKNFLSQIVSAETEINDLKHSINTHSNQNELAYLFTYIQGLNQQFMSTNGSESTCIGYLMEDSECNNVKGVIDLNDILEKSLFEEHSTLIRSTPEVKNILCNYFKLKHPSSSINFGEFVCILKPIYSKTSNERHCFENSIINFTQIVDAIVNNYFKIEALRQELSSIEIQYFFMQKYGDESCLKIESLKSFMHDAGIYNKDAFAKVTHYIFDEEKTILWESILTQPNHKEPKELSNQIQTVLIHKPSNLFEKVDELESKLKNVIKKREGHENNSCERVEKKVSDKINELIDEKLKDVESYHIIKYGVPGTTLLDKKVSINKENREEIERMCPWSTTEKIAEIERRAIEMQGRGETDKNADFNEFWKLRFKEHYFPEPSKIFLRTNYRISY